VSVVRHRGGGGRDVLHLGLPDRFGLSWQVVPKRLFELLGDPDQEKAERVMAAMLQMRKLEIAPLEEAATGSGAPAV
jgi:predicted 3-demethylubiquinone-9 3-methyltransferase (glyoxalase superfamily)